MNKKSLLFLLGFFIVIYCDCKTLQNNINVQKIVGQSHLNMYFSGNNFRTKVSMKIVDKKNKVKLRRFIYFRKNILGDKTYDFINDFPDQKYFVYFLEPNDVRNMSYLVWRKDKKNDMRWLFLPSIGLVKRISISDKRSSFVGSDFTYEDISGRDPNFDKHEIISVSDSIYKIKSTPKKNEESFSYYIQVIDKRKLIPLKISFFNSKNKKIKEYKLLKIEVIDGFLTITKSIMNDLITKRKTYLNYNQINYKIKIPNNFFSKSSMKNPPYNLIFY